MAYIKNNYETVFADHDAHVWQDSAIHSWIKEVALEVLRRLSIISEVLPDKFNLSLIDFKHYARELVHMILASALKLRYRVEALIDKFLMRH